MWLQQTHLPRQAHRWVLKVPSITRRYHLGRPPTRAGKPRQKNERPDLGWVTVRCILFFQKKKQLGRCTARTFRRGHSSSGSGWRSSSSCLGKRRHMAEQTFSGRLFLFFPLFLSRFCFGSVSLCSCSLLPKAVGTWRSEGCWRPGDLEERTTSPSGLRQHSEESGETSRKDDVSIFSHC